MEITEVRVFPVNEEKLKAYVTITPFYQGLHFRLCAAHARDQGALRGTHGRQGL